MIKIIAVGTKQEPLFAEAVAAYGARLKQLGVKYEWRLVPHEPIAEKARGFESALILMAIKPQDYVLLCDERGVSLSSAQLAAVVEKTMTASQDLVCIIGGAYGVDESVRQRANTVLAFGSSVFPHQLMRVMLLEQLYRSVTIMRNLPYHNT
jgi:23S rRNA (pseudouridine1915-N3)-methyltransferase